MTEPAQGGRRRGAAETPRCGGFANAIFFLFARADALMKWKCWHKALLALDPICGILPSSDEKSDIGFGCR
jgi:hypothetical protein